MIHRKYRLDVGIVLQNYEDKIFPYMSDMVEKGQNHQIPAYMFVEFDDIFLYFLLSDNPPTKIMKRNHEIRTEECVCITNNLFKSMYSLNI